MGQNGVAGPDHMRRVDRIADALQRQIGFDAGRHVEHAAVQHGPAAMRLLSAAQIGRRLVLHLQIALAEEVFHQDVFGRDGGVRLEIEGEVAVVPLLVEQRLRAAGDGVLELAGARKRSGAQRGFGEGGE